MAFTTTLIDEHDEVGNAKRQASTIADAQSHREHERALAAGNQAFESAFRAWRRGRAEYKKLADAIRADKPLAGLLEAAAAAGYSTTEVAEFCNSRRSALRNIEPAKQLAAAQKRYDAAERKYRAIDARYPLARTSSRATRFLTKSRPRRTSGRPRTSRLSKAQTASRIVEAVRAEGLI